MLNENYYLTVEKYHETVSRLAQDNRYKTPCDIEMERLKAENTELREELEEAKEEMQLSFFADGYYSEYELMEDRNVLADEEGVSTIFGLAGHLKIPLIISHDEMLAEQILKLLRK